MLAGQARNRRAQLDGLGLLQRQVAQAGLGQAAGTETEEQRATRLRMAEPAEQHGAGVVVFQPGWIGHEHAALLDTVAELEEAIVAGLDDPDDPVFVALLDQQTFFAHHSPPPPLRRLSPGAPAKAPQHSKAGPTMDFRYCNDRWRRCGELLYHAAIRFPEHCQES